MMTDISDAERVAAIRELCEKTIEEAEAAKRLLHRLEESDLSPKELKSLMLGAMVTADQLRHASIGFDNKAVKRPAPLNLKSIKDLLGADL